MIKRIVQFYKGKVLFHKYQIGNNYDDSITISYFYKDSTSLVSDGVGNYSNEGEKPISHGSIFPLGNFTRFLLNLCFFLL